MKDDMMQYSASKINQLDSSSRVHLTQSFIGHSSTFLLGYNDENNAAKIQTCKGILSLQPEEALLGILVRITDKEEIDCFSAQQHLSLNAVQNTFLEKAHLANFFHDFDACKLTPETISSFDCPFVKESQLKAGLEIIQQTPISETNSILLSCKIRSVVLPDDKIDETGKIATSSELWIQDNGIGNYAQAQHLSDLSMEKPVKKRPDNVVFNEDSKKYDAALMPYATNIGAPVIVHEEVSTWKNRGISRVNHHLKTQFDNLKTEYDQMKEVYYWNDLLYKTSFSFEPVIGEIYHLYSGKNGKLILSLISPDQWKHEHIGTFRLNIDQMWEKL